MFLPFLGAQVDSFAALPDLEQLLRGHLDAARGAHPEISLGDAPFLRHLAEKVPPAGDARAELQSIHMTDLFLACACAAGDAAALRTFEKDFLSSVNSYLGRLAAQPGLVDDVKQALRMRMLVATPERPPRIADYSGQGPLGGWLRVAAARAAVDLQREHARDGRNDRSRPVTAGAAPDPEMDYLKLRCRQEFQGAFEATLAALSAREANVLRLYFMNGMTAEAIADLYRASLRTVRRWIADARQRVLEDTRKRLAERMDLSVSQIDTVMGMVHSQVDLNLSELLNPKT